MSTHFIKVLKDQLVSPLAADLTPIHLQPSLVWPQLSLQFPMDSFLNLQRSGSQNEFASEPPGERVKTQIVDPTCLDFWLSRSGWGLKICISAQPSSGTNAAVGGPGFGNYWESRMKQTCKQKSMRVCFTQRWKQLTIPPLVNNSCKAQY